MKGKFAVLVVAVAAALGVTGVASAHNGTVTFDCGKASFQFNAFANGKNTVRLYYTIDGGAVKSEKRTFNGTSHTAKLEVPFNPHTTHTVVLWATWGDQPGSQYDTETADDHSGSVAPKQFSTAGCKDDEETTPPVDPPVTPPVVVPPVTLPPIVVAPPVPQRNTILFCVQTSNRGWSTVEADPDAFKTGAAWYNLFVTKASVLVAGHVLNLTGIESWEPGNGVVIAPNTINGCDGANPKLGVPVIK